MTFQPTRHSTVTSTYRLVNHQAVSGNAAQAVPVADVIRQITAFHLQTSGGVLSTVVTAGRCYGQRWISDNNKKFCGCWKYHTGSHSSSGVVRNLRQGVRKVVIFDSGRRFPDTSSRNLPRRISTFRCCSCSKGLVTSRSNSLVVTSLAENVNSK